jgi:hypothetical protein
MTAITIPSNGHTYSIADLELWRAQLVDERKLLSGGYDEGTDRIFDRYPGGGPALRQRLREVYAEIAWTDAHIKLLQLREASYAEDDVLRAEAALFKATADITRARGMMGWEEAR